MPVGLVTQKGAKGRREREWDDGECGRANWLEALEASRALVCMQLYQT